MRITSLCFVPLIVFVSNLYYWIFILNSLQGVDSSIIFPLQNNPSSSSNSDKSKEFSEDKRNSYIFSTKDESSKSVSTLSSQKTLSELRIKEIYNVSDYNYKNTTYNMTPTNNYTIKYEKFIHEKKSLKEISSINKEEANNQQPPIFNLQTNNNNNNQRLTTGASPGTILARSSNYKVDYKTATIRSIRVQDVTNGVTYKDDGISEFLVDQSASIMLLGQNFTSNTIVRFVTEIKSKGEECNVHSNSTDAFEVSDIGLGGESAIIIANFPSSASGKLFYICTREKNTDLEDPWIHQGTAPWTTIQPCKRFLPFWLQSSLIAVLLSISGLFAGLTLGLMALDRTDLKILSSTGSDVEKRYAAVILPLRERGNYLLCSLVLGNVFVNSTLTILLDQLTSGLFAVVLATSGIVIFGEIIPQAVCSRHGLLIGAKTVWITKCLMVFTFPISYTISFILDKILGEEIGFVYNREKLKELITVTSDHNDLEADEVNIISGALTMRKKTVEDIMTPLHEIYMLSIDCLLDYETLSEIRRKGLPTFRKQVPRYSRIPIYYTEKSNIVSVLYTKDLIFVDPDDHTPLKTLAETHSNQCFFLLGDTTLDVVFKEFNETKRGHMAFVQKINTSDEDKDPMFETIGLITLEDVIEELIQYNRQIKTK